MCAHCQTFITRTRASVYAYVRSKHIQVLKHTYIYVCIYSLTAPINEKLCLIKLHIDISLYATKKSLQ